MIGVDTCKPRGYELLLDANAWWMSWVPAQALSEVGEDWCVGVHGSSPRGREGSTLSLSSSAALDQSES